MSEYGKLATAMEEAVRRSCEGKEVGVVFSGGMDSGLIAALERTAPNLSSATPAERPCPELVRTDICLRFTEPN